MEALRDWMAEDHERRRYPEIWPRVTVAEHRSRVLGLCHADGREVADLWVHPSFQRRGIGSLLLRVCEEEIRRAGYAVSRLRYTGYNVAAPLFYRARGYSEVSRSPESLPSGVTRDIIVMEKRLHA